MSMRWWARRLRRGSTSLFLSSRPNAAVQYHLRLGCHHGDRGWSGRVGR
jgi:hypothetical protein